MRKSFAFRSKPGLTISLVVLIFSISNGPIHAKLSPNELKETYNPINEKYKRISPLNGGITLFKELPQNVFLYCNPLNKLVKALFKHVPGQFTSRKDKALPAAHITPEIIAKIISLVETFIDKKIEKLGPEQISYLETLITTEIKKLDVRMLQNKDIDNLKNSIAQTYEISGYFDDKPNLFKNALHNILLAFLCEKSKSRKDLQYFFRELDESFFKPGEKNHVLSNEWLSETHNVDDISKIESIFSNAQNKLAAIEKNMEQYSYAQAIKTLSVDFLGPVGYRRVTLKTPAFECKKTTLKIEEQAFRFPNCTEVTILSFLSEFFLDRESFLFDPIKKAKQYRTLNIHPKLFKFYKEIFTKPEFKEQQHIHNAFTSIISSYRTNILEGVVYKKINDLENPTKHGVKKPKKSDGFVFIKNLEKQLSQELFEGTSNRIRPIKINDYELTELTVGKRKYILVSPEKYPNLIAYEIKPSVRNFITILYHLFDLPILKKTQGNFLQKTLLNTAFNSTHIEDACKQLGFTQVHIPSKHQIDTNDLTKETVEVEIRKNESFMRLLFSMQH